MEHIGSSQEHQPTVFFFSSPIPATGWRLETGMSDGFLDLSDDTHARIPFDGKHAT
jgi:hypothetical protein